VAFLACQKHLGTGKLYIRFVWGTSKTNDARYVLQERIVFQNRLFNFNQDSRNM
jgi:hypothetical protein